MKACRLAWLCVFVVGFPGFAAAQVANNSFATSVHLLVGQTPVRASLASAGSAFYDAPVVQNRSYCAEATASETESSQTDATLAVFHQDQSGITTTEGKNLEPKGASASRRCFIAATTETIFLELTNNAAGTAEYSMRFVETTLWANWFYAGGDYSSYAIIRNTTSAPVSVDLRWFAAANGAQVGAMTGQTVAANGVLYVDARSAMSCPYPTPCTTQAGSVQVAHAASPEAIVGSATTLSSTTGLSFDTIFFQRKPW